MARLFISYKRVDKDKVFKIKDQIESALGEKCWLDIDGIESDAQFANVIINAINTCEVFLFMYSSAHALISDYKNDWTVRELDFAQHKKKRIVFVNIDASSLTDWFYMLFGTIQQVDATSHEQLSKLIQDIKGWLGYTKLSPTEVNRPILPESNKTGISFSINALRKNKGCSIALTVAFILCVVVLPLRYLSFEKEVDESAIVGNTNDYTTEEHSHSTSNPSFTARPSDKDGVTATPPKDEIQQQEQDVPCEKCHGTGMVENLVCNHCKGTGINTNLTGQESIQILLFQSQEDWMMDLD